jgi:ankyrin repeat protein
MQKTGKPEPVDDGGTGPVIHEALDNHTALVELLIKNGADEKLKEQRRHGQDF